MKKLFYLLSVIPVLALGQSQDQNYIKTTTYKQPSSQVTVDVTNPAEAAVQVIYYDGLGRPVQQLAHKQSGSGKDIITPIEYDEFGRQTKEYLPYANGTPSLDYTDPTTVSSDLSSFYSTYNGGTTNPFSEKELESSPLDRVFKQAAPGNDWALGSGKEIKFAYQTNSANEVIQFRATATWNASLLVYDIAITNEGFYSTNELYKTVTQDENWTSGLNHTTEEFKNKEGQVLLKRTYNSGVAHDTYYVYDQYNNLTFVIPPLANGAITQTVLDGLCYQYKYDIRNRLVEKKLPGKQWEFIIYDTLDQPIATGPALTPYGGTAIGWLITQYDVFGRVIKTGWKQMTANANTRYTNQNSINSGSTPFTLSESETLTRNYYDTYNFPGAPTLPNNIEGQSLSVNVKGFPTGTWIRVLDTPGSTTAETSYTLYDDKYRPVRTYTTNYLGGYTQVDTKLDWAGKTMYTVTRHKYDPNDTEINIKDTYTYTDQDRLLTHRQKIDGESEELIALNDYDELGQLITKLVGGTGTNGLQKINYSYNIRGWLNGINDPTNNLSDDLFAFAIKYNDAEEAEKLYNGNISETYWKTANDNILRSYRYSYDDLNRLTAANYQWPGISHPDTFQETVRYDKNGNITKLNRYGNSDTVATIIDDLKYFYDSENNNQLVKVTDYSSVPQGFKDDSTGANNDDPENDYKYDANGNLTLDQNKGIESIAYNHLNLPVMIKIPASGQIMYLYNALGVKVKKSVTATSTIKTDYMTGGFQYSDTRLQYFPHSEGYVSVAEGRFKYVYNYTDHLGNIRLSYSDANGDNQVNSSEILEENNYYPFGLEHKVYNNVVSNAEYLYKYNGKELQDELGLNFYDYGARFYDPATGRWYSVDEMAEKYLDMSPYNYALNNPVIFVDPDGNQVEMCCEGLKGFVLGMVDNLAGTNFRNKFDSGSQAYKTGVNAANGTSLAVGGILTTKGLIDTTAGAAGLATSGTATVASGGLAAEVTAPAAAVSGTLLGIGLAETALGGNLLNNTVNNMNSDATNANSSSSDSRTANSDLRRNSDGTPAIDPEAEGTAHSQLGTKDGRNGEYRQAREFDSDGNPVRDIDFTDHGRPGNHTNPHQHRYNENSTGGTRQRGSQEPLD